MSTSRRLLLIGATALLGVALAALPRFDAAAVPAQSFCTNTASGPCPVGATAVDWDVCYDLGLNTTINQPGGITSGATSVTVAATAGFPAAGAIQIDAEAILYTGTTATSFTGLTRGYNGTSPSAHADTAAVINYGRPRGPGLSCAPGTSDSAIPLGVPGVSVRQWHLTRIPSGSRPGLPITYTPGDWQYAAPAPGAVTGNVTAESDVFCDAGPTDILSSAPLAPPGGSPSWPGNGWTPFDLKSQAIPPAGDNAYVTQFQPMPSTFSYKALERGDLTQIWLSGNFGPQFIPPTTGTHQGTPLQNLYTNSPYVAGLEASVTVLGADLNPPDNQFICRDTPQDSVVQYNQTVPPTVPGNYVRWIAITSSPDPIDGTVTRVLQTRCVNVGGAAGTCDLSDADLDLVPRDVEVAIGTEPSVADTDGDGATDYDEIFQFTDPVAAPPMPIVSSTNTSPITVEATGHGLWTGACVTIAGHAGNASANGTWTITAVDADHFTLNGSAGSAVGGASGTAAVVSTDTDCDGSLDKQDDLAGFNCASVNGICTAANLGDTTADDNCPVIANPGQANTDSQPDFTNSPNTPAGAIYRGDATNPHQNHLGDACDPDMDNDGLSNLVEAGFLLTNLAPGSAGGPDPGTLWCLPDGSPAPAGGMTLVTTFPLNPDSDSDGGLDGRECQFGSNPKDAGANSCSPACSGGNRYPTTVASIDPDGDQLFPAAAETYYRTQGINLPGGARLNDLEQPGSYGAPSPPLVCADVNAAAVCDNKIGTTDNDADGDGLNDGIEVKWYATSPANFDTDGDGCSDGREAADVNGNHKVDSTDLLAVAQHSPTGSLAPGKATVLAPLGSLPNPPAVPGPAYNVSGVRRGDVATYDVNKDGKIDSTDLLIVAKLSGNCLAGIGAQVAQPIARSAK
jgi:hypothetical protein